MIALLESGRLIDIILALMVIEAVALLVWRRRTGRGLSSAAILLNVAAGACLMGALRAAIVGAGASWILGGLALALVMHMADLAVRLRER